MKKQIRLVFALLILVLLAFAAHAQAQNFGVTASGLNFYVINGTNNPTLTLQRGVTYVFQLNVIGHPFWIKTARGIGQGNQYNNGVTGNGSQTGTLTFAVPTNAPNQLHYQCEHHGLMGGTLNIVAPPTPPDVKIVFVNISSSNIVVKSTGASNWAAIPEFKSNLVSAAWSTVPSYTNSFANGTNTTTFNRLDPICGPSVFIRIRNQSN